MNTKKENIHEDILIVFVKLSKNTGENLSKYTTRKIVILEACEKYIDKSNTEIISDIEKESKGRRE